LHYAVHYKRVSEGPGSCALRREKPGRRALAGARENLGGCCCFESRTRADSLPRTSSHAAARRGGARSFARRRRAPEKRRPAF
jgi:hypothetical protein